MKAKLILGSLIALLFSAAPLSYAEPTAEALRDTIRQHIAKQEKLQGAFVIVDERTDELRRLELVGVHERVGKTGDYYYSCTDMRDVATGELLDLDFDIEDKDGKLRVVQIFIHKDDGIPRYTYGDNDKKVSLPVAMLKGTQPGSPIEGKVSFMELEGEIKINAVVFNAPPGKHGFHIHENGSCEDGGKAAGGHFNPDGHDHGDVVKDGLAKAHAGDLGNLEVREDGKGTFQTVVKGLTLQQPPYNVVGRSVILHEKPDDFGQPTGNAGARIACAVIPPAN